MWPALIQLIELAPHVKRLVPMADRYLQSKAETRESQRRAFAEMSDGLRGELDKVTDGLRGDVKQLSAAQANVLEQVQRQGETISELVVEMRTAQLAASELEARLTRIETRMQQMRVVLLVGLGLIAVTAAGVIAVLVEVHGRS